MKFSFKQIIVCVALATLMTLQGIDNAESKVNQLFQLGFFSWLLFGVFAFLFAIVVIFSYEPSVFWVKITPIIGSCFVLSAIVTLVRAHQIDNLNNVYGFAVAAAMFGLGIITGSIYKLNAVHDTKA